MTGGFSLCILEKEDKMEMAASWLFAEFLATNAEFQAAYSVASSYMPVIESATKTDTFKTWIDEANAAKDTNAHNNHLQALAVQVALEQADGFFIPDAFLGSATAQKQVGELLLEIFFTSLPVDADIDAEIKKLFEKAINTCKAS